MTLTFAPHQDPDAALGSYQEAFAGEGDALLLLVPGCCGCNQETEPSE
jgi:hypothetical protein